MADKMLTISVAAYNLGNMIRTNLDSLIKAKNAKMLEVIVTDDGSKDNTAEIVQEYVKKYPGIVRLIHQKNTGAGSTVNSGIKHATGKYFKMIDGDDWVQTDQVEKLLEYLAKTETDMIITNHLVYDESQSKIIQRFSFETALPDNKSVKFENICNSVQLNMHNVTYRTSILSQNEIRLDNGFYTDVEYLLYPLAYVTDMVYFNLDVYVYRVGRAGQSVSLASLQKHLDMHDLVLHHLIEYYKSSKYRIPENTRMYIAKRIGIMADAQLMTLLTYKMDKAGINRIKKYFKHIKRITPDEIYSQFISGKKEKILIYSDFIFTRLLSKMVVKKLA